MLREKLRKIIEKAIIAKINDNKLGQLKSLDEITIIIEKPKNPDFGDFSINVLGGFINFKLNNSFYNEAVENILNKKEKFGSNDFGAGEKVLLEYVSANPTGPLHIGHGRWAAMGSALANLMKKSGYDVTQEFYINDAGNQINNLAHSLFIRVLQELGVDISFPTDEIEVKNFYTGDYLIKTAKEFVEEKPEQAQQLKEKGGGTVSWFEFIFSMTKIVKKWHWDAFTLFLSMPEGAKY